MGLDVSDVQKLLALVWTQIHVSLRTLLAVPWAVAVCALRDAQLAAGIGQKEAEAGCVFYEGYVVHSRKQPVQNSFRYPVRVALIDLDAPPAWFRAQASDHLSAARAREMCGSEGAVKLLTNPRAAGYDQNPISVYYCYSSGGELAMCIAEVTNTPWAERVTFLFQPGQQEVPKSQHVSPFMDMSGTWLLRSTPPSQRLALSVGVRHPSYGRFFDADLQAHRCTGPFSALRNEEAGLRVLLRYGFYPQRVAAWIYWQAGVLAGKGCPLSRKPGVEEYRVGVEGASNPRARPGGESFLWRAALQWPWYK